MRHAKTTSSDVALIFFDLVTLLILANRTFHHITIAWSFVYIFSQLP
jgi:hypothetical protein